MPDLASSIQFSPWQAFVLVAVAGALTSLGPCTFTRAMAFTSYLGTQKELSQRRSLYLALIFVAGLTVSYTFLGLAAYLAVNLFRLGTYMYYAAGAIAVLGGLHFAEIIRLRLPSDFRLAGYLRGFAARRGGSTGFFGMGSAFGLMICPCCLPPIFTIFAFTFAKGKLAYGIILLFVFTLVHSIPLIAASAFTGTLGVLKKVQIYRAYVSVISGSLMVTTGLLLLWIA